MTEQDSELILRIRANRFRHEQSGLAAALGTLLGSAAEALDFVTLDRADQLFAEFQYSYNDAKRLDTAVGRTWPQEDIEHAVNSIHALIEPVGARLVWLIVKLTEPQAIAVPGEVVLDNPLGFAALADREVRLLDRELPAGLWLLRHSHHYGPTHTEYSWELAVWGEPWASATTRALRN